MYDNKFYGYVINSALKHGKAKNQDEPDYQKVGLCGILNFLYSTNPQKSYFGFRQDKEDSKVG